MAESTRISGTPNTRFGLREDPDPENSGIQRRPTFTEPAVRNESLRALGPVVYAARVEGGLIKIGFTTNLAARLVSLPGVTHASILGFSLQGTYEAEQAIHDSLAEHVHHGREWYNPTQGVMDVVNQMRETLGLEPVAA